MTQKIERNGINNCCCWKNIVVPLKTIPIITLFSLGIKASKLEDIIFIISVEKTGLESLISAVGLHNNVDLNILLINYAIYRKERTR